MKITAPASCGPTREIALLIADATPEFLDGTLVMSAVVSGATIIESPKPKSRVAGRKSTNQLAGGRSVPASPNVKSHGLVVAGTRRYQSVPRHMSAGPMDMNSFGPYFPDSAPKRELRNTRNSPEGTNARPAAAAVNPMVPCTNSVMK